ncbi:MAG: TIGR02452 family protein [Bacteroidales bacterium]|nr:TIGR02452 family protein [Bacteroidales bacterium]
MEFTIIDNILKDIIEPEIDVHIPEGVVKLSADVFNFNKITKNVYFPASLVDCSEYRSLIFRYQENIYVNDDNPIYSSHNGVLYSKDMMTLLCCPMGKTGTFKTAPTTKEIAQDAFCCSLLDELILNEGLESIHRWAFADSFIKKPILVPQTVKYISKKAFEGEWSGGNVIVYPDSYAHDYAKEVEYVKYTCVPYDDLAIWNHNDWKINFSDAKEKCLPDLLHALRKQVFISTLEIAKAGKYQLSDGSIVSLKLEKNICAQTKLYSEEILENQYPKRYNTQIAAVNDDCLSFARKVCAIESDVCVLNMASRRNPGGGVLGGAGAQEEYLFRCSDYYRSLYQYAPYSEQYGIKRSDLSYPLNKDFGGVFTPNVTIFRDNEEEGYRLLHHPWKVNMIAVAGMNRPELITVDGNERIAPHLVLGIKNKIRTIFRIAASNGQKTLVLGALGCGAFRNPPKHTAELFYEVINEPEFKNVFRRVFFVIKEDHNSRGLGNYQPFADLFGSFPKNRQLEPEGLLYLADCKTNAKSPTHSHIEKNRCTPSSIKSLKENEVFVFGTNPEGNHNSAAAKFAVQAFGAQIGVSEGLQGQSYAIPVHKHRTEKMHAAIQRFIDFAKRNTDKIFYVLPIGCGKAGMETMTVAMMFKDAIEIENVYLPDAFISAIRDSKINNLTFFNMNKGKMLHSERFGNGLNWSLYGDGTLEISGYGSMPDYTNHWDSYFGEGQPKWIGCERYGVMPYRLIISNGITYVGANAFESFGCLKQVYLADSVVKLGKMAFFDCFHIEKINIPPNMSLKYFNKAELPLFYNNAYMRIENWLIDKNAVYGERND